MGNRQPRHHQRTRQPKNRRRRMAKPRRPPRPYSPACRHCPPSRHRQPTARRSASYANKAATDNGKWRPPSPRRLHRHRPHHKRPTGRPPQTRRPKRHSPMRRLLLRRCPRRRPRLGAIDTAPPAAVGIIRAFFARPQTFTLGVCNGCQALSHLQSLMPAADRWQFPTFHANESRRFEARSVHGRKSCPSPSPPTHRPHRPHVPHRRLTRRRPRHP